MTGLRVEMSKTAETIGRNGRFEISALQLVTALSHDLVFIDPISRKEGSALNAGMVMTTVDMDRLAKMWTEHRAQENAKKRDLRYIATVRLHIEADDAECAEEIAEESIQQISDPSVSALILEVREADEEEAALEGGAL